MLFRLFLFDIARQANYRGRFTVSQAKTKPPDPNASVSQVLAYEAKSLSEPNVAKVQMLASLLILAKWSHPTNDQSPVSHLAKMWRLFRKTFPKELPPA